MLTGIAREEMRNMLKLSKEKDLRSIESKIVRRNLEGQSTAERIEAILDCASQPSDVLRQKRMRKTVMLQYLWNRQVSVSQEQYKHDYIRVLLDMWEVKDDEYLWRFCTGEEIESEINRFQEMMTTGLHLLKLRIRESELSPKELQYMKKFMDKVIQKIDSIGNTASTFPFQGPAHPRPLSAEDVFSSSQAGPSAEAIECTPDIQMAPTETSRAQSSESAPQHEYSTATSTSQQPSSVNTNPSSYQPSSSIKSSEPWSSEQVSMDVQEHVSPGPPISAHSNQSTSPSKRINESSSRSQGSKRISQSSSRSQQSKHKLETSPSKQHIKVSNAGILCKHSTDVELHFEGPCSYSTNFKCHFEKGWSS